VVHFRYGPSVPFPQHSTPPRGDAVEFMFRREQSNSTGGTFTHVEASFTGAGSVFSVISCWISRRRGIAQTWISFRVFRVFRGYISGRGRTAGRHGNFGQSRPEIFEIE